MTDPNGLLYMNARYYSPYICRFLNPDPTGFSGGLNFYAYANGNPVSYLDPFGLSPNWRQVITGSAELAGGLVYATLVGLAEAPSAGTVSVAIPSVSLLIVHGMTELATGIQNDPNNTAAQNFVNVFPSNLGQVPGAIATVSGYSGGQSLEQAGGLVWDVGSLGLGSGPELINSINSGKNLGLNATQFGLDVYGVGSDASDLFGGSDNSSAANGIFNPVNSTSLTSDWIPSSFNQSSSSSTGK